MSATNAVLIIEFPEFPHSYHFYYMHENGESHKQHFQEPYLFSRGEHRKIFKKCCKGHEMDIIEPMVCQLHHFRGVIPSLGEKKKSCYRLTGY